MPKFEIDILRTGRGWESRTLIIEAETEEAARAFVEEGGDIYDKAFDEALDRNDCDWGVEDYSDFEIEDINMLPETKEQS